MYDNTLNVWDKSELRECVFQVLDDPDEDGLHMGMQPVVCLQQQCINANVMHDSNITIFLFKPSSWWQGGMFLC